MPKLFKQILMNARDALDNFILNCDSIISISFEKCLISDMIPTDLIF